MGGAINDFNYFMSIATAETLYNQCDGLEYEHSSSLLDLRYVHMLYCQYIRCVSIMNFSYIIEERAFNLV